ncbi:plasmid mobilization relaxosome protein MobC [Kitasatospora sp. NPDC028055]|uniref:plasmid mobilization protein n=1 Tax=Kitasatospora sp. NPDC028055 TaxID=3155653 RepID=UPI0033C3394C
MTSRAGALDSSPVFRHQGVPGGKTEEEKIESLNDSVELPAEPPADAPPARRPRRRHRDPESRSHKLTVRLNTDEKTEIDAAAALRAVTVGRFLATSAISAARGTAANRDPQDRLDRAVDELASSRAQLARVGNNLNQMVFGLNAAGYVQPAELAPTLGAVRAAVAAIDAAAAQLVTGGPIGP